MAYFPKVLFAREDLQRRSARDELGPDIADLMRANTEQAVEQSRDELADDFVKLAWGIGMPIKTEQEARKAFDYLADMAQYVAQKSPGSFRDYVEAMKYVGATVRSRR